MDSELLFPGDYVEYDDTSSVSCIGPKRSQYSPSFNDGPFSQTNAVLHDEMNLHESSSEVGEWHDSRNPQYCSDSEDEAVDETSGSFSVASRPSSSTSSQTIIARSLRSGSSTRRPSSIRLTGNETTQLVMHVRSDARQQEPRHSSICRASSGFTSDSCGFSDTSPASSVPDSAFSDAASTDKSSDSDEPLTSEDEHMPSRTVHVLNSKSSFSFDYGRTLNREEELEQQVAALLRENSQLTLQLDVSTKAIAEVERGRDHLKTQVSKQAREIGELRRSLHESQISYSNAFTHLKNEERKVVKHQEDSKKLSEDLSHLREEYDDVVARLNHQIRIARSLSSAAEENESRRKFVNIMMTCNNCKQTKRELVHRRPTRSSTTTKGKWEYLPELPVQPASPAKSVVHNGRLYVTFTVDPEEHYMNLKSCVNMYRLSSDTSAWELQPFSLLLQEDGCPSALLSVEGSLFLVMQSKSAGDHVFQLCTTSAKAWTHRRVAMCEEHNCAVTSFGSQIVFAGGSSIKTQCALPCVKSFNLSTMRWDVDWPALNVPREGGVLTHADNGTLQIVGGTIRSIVSLAATSSIEELNLVTMDGWKNISIAPFPCSSVTRLKDGTTFLAGGLSALSKQFEYGGAAYSGTTVLDLSQISPLLVARAGASMCVYENQVICLGGRDSTGYIKAVERLQIC